MLKFLLNYMYLNVIFCNVWLVEYIFVYKNLMKLFFYFYCVLNNIYLEYYSFFIVVWFCLDCNLIVSKLFGC